MKRFIIDALSGASITFAAVSLIIVAFCVAVWLVITLGIFLGLLVVLLVGSGLVGLGSAIAERWF